MDLTAKTRGRNKFLKCFHLTVADDREFVKPNRLAGSENPVLRYVGVGEKEDQDSAVISKFLKSSARKCNFCSEGDVAGGGRCARKGRFRPSFSRVLNAVFSESSLANTIRRKKSGQVSFRSCSSDKFSIQTDERIIAFQESETANSSRSSSLLSSSSSPRSSSVDSLSGRRNVPVLAAKSIGLKPTQEKNPRHCAANKKPKSDVTNVRLVLLLLCLLVLMLWGKFCAIVCTFTWLVLAPRGAKTGVSPSPSPSPSPDIDSDEYKKRVIMVGLLERHRNREV